MCTTWMLVACEGWKWVSDHLEVEWQRGVNCHVGARNQCQLFCRSHQSSFTSESSLVPLPLPTFYPCLLYGTHWTWVSLIQLALPSTYLCLRPQSQVLELQTCSAGPNFYMDAGHLCWSPHACSPGPYRLSHLPRTIPPPLLQGLSHVVQARLALNLLSSQVQNSYSSFISQVRGLQVCTTASRSFIFKGPGCLH